MGDVKVPNWLKKLPLAPEFHPTDTEFADPIAYISKIEREASAFGICKVIPPLPKPSKKYVFSNLNKSLAKAPELCSGCLPTVNGDRAVFTTRHQELGHSLKRSKGQGLVGQSAVHKQVWQSGEVYTLEQFESKSKAFARNHLGGNKALSPLAVEALFWKAALEKAIYIEYANDVPGSGFGEPEDLSQYFQWRRRRRKSYQRGQAGLNLETHEIDSVTNCYTEKKENVSLQHGSGPSVEMSGESSSSERQRIEYASKDGEGTAGWKLSNSPWNLQVIARSPGSLTRYMLENVPGVTSPMIYIGMLFSWFAWHVEDHELHSLNFLHTGSPKTWYAVPGDCAFTFEEVIRSQGYGGNLDRLAALTFLGEKTNLLSPEVVVASGIPCCRLVQNPGEYVVTFPRAYHVGFSHGFNCGEAANFGTPQWLKVAKEAAVRRAAMNYLPMLSHQQLLYLLTMSFISSVPRALLPGARTSRLKDRQKEDRELLVKKSFIEDILNEHKLLSILLGKESTFCAVLWDPDSLPMPSNVPQSFHVSGAPDASCPSVGERDAEICKPELCCAEKGQNGTLNLSNTLDGKIPVDLQNTDVCNNQADTTRMHMEKSEDLYVDDDDLPCGLRVDSGTLACVACGILGFPFMSIVQPSQRASEELFPADSQMDCEGLGVASLVNPSGPVAMDQIDKKFSSDARDSLCENKKQKVSSNCGRHVCTTETSNCGWHVKLMETCLGKSSTDAGSSSLEASANVIELKDATSSQHQLKASSIAKLNSAAIHSADTNLSQVSKDMQVHSTSKVYKEWNTFSPFLGPRVFCLEHALETEELLRAKGGANVLITCHSAYPKIRAHASSVAEEIGAPFICDEVPLENASKEDLDLINTSICNETYEECGKDWTSRLGLNIHYCVKLRKISEAKQEHAFSLGHLFSEPISCSDISSLKWKSKRSRTFHKATTQNQSKSCQSTQIKRSDIEAEKQERRQVTGENKIIQYYRRKCKTEKPSCSTLRKQQVEEECKSNGFPDNRGMLRRIEDAENDFVDLSGSSTVNTEKQHEVLTAEETNKMSKAVYPAESAGPVIIKNTESDCAQLVMPSNVDYPERQHDDCATEETNKMSGISDPAKSAGLIIIKNTETDIAQLVRLSNVDYSERQHDDCTIEKTRKMISDPLAFGNRKNDSHHLATSTTVENFEIVHKVQETGETTENSEVSARANAAVLLDTESTGNDTGEPVGSTLRAEELHDRAEAAVQHATSDLVLGNFKEQVKNQVLEKIDVEEQHEVRTEGAVEHSISAVQHAVHDLVIQTLEERIKSQVIEKIDVEDNPEKEYELRMEGVLKRAKSAVQRAVHNLVLQSLEEEMKNQVLEQISVEDNSEMQHEVRTANDEFTDYSLRYSTSFTRSLHAQIEGKSLAASVLENEACGMILDTFSMQKCGRTVNEANEARVGDLTCQPSHMVPILESSVEHTISTIEEVNIEGESCSTLLGNIAPESTHTSIIDPQPTMRDRNKSKRGVEQLTEDSDGYIRSPCEGLRPRTSRTTACATASGVAGDKTRRPLTGSRLNTKVEIATKKAKGPPIAPEVCKGRKAISNRVHRCVLEGCRMSFKTKEELAMHKRNRCTHKGCGKLFSSHRYVMLHRKVHVDARPLKCSWKGCKMSFKWAWARTEHMRVHTGERPYQCKIEGCGRTFRYVSAFSRHRRKTGHYVKTPS